MCSRYTYVDVVPNSSWHSYMEVLKRSISSFGATKLIISDNGQSFSQEVNEFILLYYLKE